MVARLGDALANDVVEVGRVRHWMRSPCADVAHWRRSESVHLEQPDLDSEGIDFRAASGSFAAFDVERSAELAGVIRIAEIVRDTPHCLWSGACERTTVAKSSCGRNYLHRLKPVTDSSPSGLGFEIRDRRGKSPLVSRQSSVDMQLKWCPGESSPPAIPRAASIVRVALRCR